MARTFAPLRRRIERRLRKYRVVCLDADEAKREYDRMLEMHPQLVEQTGKHRRLKAADEATKRGIDILAKKDYKLHGETPSSPHPRGRGCERGSGDGATVPA